MATGSMKYTPLMQETVEASGAISQYRFVGHDNAQINTEGKKARGVALFDIDDGKPGTLVTRGSALVEASGAIAAGAAVGSDASGKAKTAADILVDIGGTVLPGDLLVNVVNGYAKEAAAADGDIIEVDLSR